MDSRENLAILKNPAQRKKVHFLGFRRDALNIVRGCDFFVLSSLLGEALTKSVIEAMSCKIPCIITDISGNKDLVEDGISGIVVKANEVQALQNAMIQLSEKVELREKYGNNAQKHIEKNINILDTISQMKDLYLQIT